MTPKALSNRGVRAARIRALPVSDGRGQATTEVVLLFPLFMFFLFAFAKVFAMLILVQKMEIASFYAARRWQLESHRNVDYVDSFDMPALKNDIEDKVSKYIGFGTSNESFLDLVRLTGHGVKVEVTPTQVWNVVTLTARTKPINVGFWKNNGFTFEVTKYVPNRDRPIAFILPGLQGEGEGKKAKGEMKSGG